MNQQKFEKTTSTPPVSALSILAGATLMIALFDLPSYLALQQNLTPLWRALHYNLLLAWGPVLLASLLLGLLHGQRGFLNAVLAAAILMMVEHSLRGIANWPGTFERELESVYWYDVGSLLVSLAGGFLGGFLALWIPSSWFPPSWINEKAFALLCGLFGLAGGLALYSHGLDWYTHTAHHPRSYFLLASGLVLILGSLLWPRQWTVAFSPLSDFQLGTVEKGALGVILGVLLTVYGIYPQLKAWQVSKEEAQCKAHLRRIIQAVRQLRADRHGTLPGETIGVLKALYPRYINDPSVFLCPADPAPETLEEKGWKLANSYVILSLNSPMVRAKYAQYDDRLAFILCLNHSPSGPQRPGRFAKEPFILFARLNGRVEKITEREVTQRHLGSSLDF